MAAPALRRRLRLPRAAVLGAAASAPLALCLVRPSSKVRNVAVVALDMWAYIAAYEMPNDDPQRLAKRAHVRYPFVADRILGLGVLPTIRLQGTFATPGKLNRFERALVFCHWLWFAVPHCSVAYVLLRKPENFGRAAARMYTVFDVGAILYWAIPTAPPWWASDQGRLQDGGPVPVRRMMIEYGPEFWGDLWGPLYDVLGGNPLAAMPSLHFASSLMGAHLLSEVDPVAGAVGWTYAGALGLALVYLGEHYLIDVIAGAAFTEAVRAGAPRAAPAARRAVALLDRISRRLAT